ncbi:hypothetical protein [Streptomyces adustus]|uniref:hypothetical protein n=1 Tax=Streptomyces adustus TaxID=1609272 RepID=UPI00371B8EF9
MSTVGAGTRELMTRMCHGSSRATLFHQRMTGDRDRAIAGRLGTVIRRTVGAPVGRVSVPLVLMPFSRDHFDMADLPDEMAAELGVLTIHTVRHAQALPHVSRAHVYRIGDGAAHLHIWFFARPEGQAQLYGSWMPVWDDLLPEYPTDVADADAVAVADALVTSYGGRREATDDQMPV